MTGTDPAEPSLTSATPGEFALVGPVTFATAGRLLEVGRAQFAGQASLTVNLKSVKPVDSAGLALLLEWLRQARAERRAMKFTDLPDKLRAIARLSDVEALLNDGYSGGAASASAGSPSESSGSLSASSR
ncbi:MAG: STAS domain-containing protein [Gammaproteobacteria bacterium]